MSRRVCKNVERGFNESWQSPGRARPKQNDPLTQQKSSDLSVLLLSEPSGPAQALVRVNEAFRAVVWSSNQPPTPPPSPSPLHASSEKHSAYYQCARLEMIHRASFLSEDTVASGSLGARRGAETCLVAFAGRD